MARGSNLSIFGKELSPVSSKTMDGYSHISGNPSNIGLFVVSDEIVAEEECSVLLVMGNFASKDKTAIAECDKKIVDFAKSNYLNANTKTGVKDSTVGLSAIATFIGLYLGIIFLISSAAILALKQLSDMIDDKSKYSILRNIGVDERDINKSIFKQTLIFFLMPLLLACVHTVYGIKFSVIVLSILGISNMTKAIAITALFIIAIYGGYFLLTYYSSLSIIRTDSSNNRIVLNNKALRKE